MIYRIKNTNDDTIKNVSVIKDYQNLHSVHQAWRSPRPLRERICGRTGVNEGGNGDK